MSDRSFASPPGPEPQALGTAGHPPVADLILYALGKGPPSDRQQIESHLRQFGCDECRRWIDQATLVRARSSSPPEPAGQRAPLADDPKWQQQAWRELERRLRMLEES